MAEDYYTEPRGYQVFENERTEGYKMSPLAAILRGAIGGMKSNVEKRRDNQIKLLQTATQMGYARPVREEGDMEAAGMNWKFIDNPMDNLEYWRMMKIQQDMALRTDPFYQSTVAASKALPDLTYFSMLDPDERVKAMEKYQAALTEYQKKLQEMMSSGFGGSETETGTDTSTGVNQSASMEDFIKSTGDEDLMQEYLQTKKKITTPRG